MRIKANKRRWWHSEKGKKHQQKLKLQRIAEKAVLGVVAEEDNQDDKEFIEWCQREHDEQVHQWKEETVQKKRQHSREYLNQCYNK